MATKAEIMQGAALFLGGGLLGVILDRICRLVEDRTRIDVWPSVSFGANNTQKLRINIRNAGNINLPPYRLGIFNPHRGSLYVFDCLIDTEQRPGEHRVFTLPDDPERLAAIRRWLDHHDPTISDDRALRTFAIRLQPENIEEPLLLDWKVGTALGAVLDAFTNGKRTLGSLSGTECQALSNYTLRSKLRNWRKSRSQTKEHNRQKKLQVKVAAGENEAERDKPQQSSR